MNEHQEKSFRQYALAPYLCIVGLCIRNSIKKVAGKVSVLFIEDYREGPFSWVPVSFCFPCTLIFLFSILHFYQIVLILQPLGGADWLGIFGYSVLSKLPRVGIEYALPDFSMYVCEYNSPPEYSR